jgi:hypothetical protein
MADHALSQGANLAILYSGGNDNSYSTPQVAGPSLGTTVDHSRQPEEHYDVNVTDSTEDQYNSVLTAVNAAQREDNAIPHTPYAKSMIVKIKIPNRQGMRTLARPKTASPQQIANTRYETRIVIPDKETLRITDIHPVVFN